MTIIVFCGIDGSGKTTQAALLKQWFEAEGIPASLVRPLDPNSRFFKNLDSLEEKTTSKGHETPKDYRALVMAFEALKNIQTTVVPNHLEGKVVICDRYVWSHLAYGLAHGVDVSWVEELLSLVPKPDKCFLMDVSVELAMQRIEQRGASPGYNEERKLLEVARYEYLRLSKTEGGVVVDGATDPMLIHEMVKRECRPLLDSNRVSDEG